MPVKRKPITIKGEGYAIQRDDGDLVSDVGIFPHVLANEELQRKRLNSFRKTGFLYGARVVKVKYTIKVVDDDAALGGK